MRKIYLSLFLASIAFVLGGSPLGALAADINFVADTTVVVNSLNLTVSAGSAASAPFTTGNPTLSVTVPSGSHLTLTSIQGFSLANSVALAQTCSGGTNSITINGPQTIVISPTPVFCTGNPPFVPPVTPAPTPEGPGGNTGIGTPNPIFSVPNPTSSTPGTIAGCGNGTIGFSTSTGQSCTNNVSVTQAPVVGCGNANTGFSTATGQSCATNPVSIPAIITGCGNSTSGFSTATGQSCVNNTVSTPVSITGCGNSTSGFSTSSGASCANNATTIVPEGSPNYNFGSTTLRNGSSGAGVMELQRFLNWFDGAGLTMDGNFGPRTSIAVMEWQGSHGLAADGSVGPLTMAQMTLWASAH